MRDMRLTPGLEEIFHTLALEGADDEVGARSQGRWAALLRNTGNLGDRIRDMVDSSQIDMTDEDVDNELWEILNTAAGVIVIREVDGTVNVEAYDGDDEVAAAWVARVTDIENEAPGNPEGIPFEEEELDEDAGYDIADEAEGDKT
jgi:hypothetical protein